MRSRQCSDTNVQHSGLLAAGSPTLSGPGLFTPSRDALSLLRFPLSKLKLDNLFLLWLAVPESQKLVSRPPSRLHTCRGSTVAHPVTQAGKTGRQQPLLLSSMEALVNRLTETGCEALPARTQVVSLLESAKLGQPLPGPTSSVALPTSAAALTQMPSQVRSYHTCLLLHMDLFNLCIQLLAPATCCTFRIRTAVGLRKPPWQHRHWSDGPHHSVPCAQPPLSPLKGRHLGSPVVPLRRVEASRLRQVHPPLHPPSPI